MGKLVGRPGVSGTGAAELTSGLSPEHHENFTAERYTAELHNLSGATKLSFAFELAVERGGGQGFRSLDSADS